jgi:hypothetical protein
MDGGGAEGVSAPLTAGGTCRTVLRLAARPEVPGGRWRQDEAGEEPGPGNLGAAQDTDFVGMCRRLVVEERLRGRNRIMSAGLTMNRATPNETRLPLCSTLRAHAPIHPGDERR